MSAPACGECGNSTALVSGAIIYPHRPDLFAKSFWRCEPCDAYVGCHPDTTTPLGTPASGVTRQARKTAHAAFDPIWKSGRLRRKEAYRRLAEGMGIPRDDCHIGMFSAAQCAQVVSLIDGGKV